MSEPVFADDLFDYIPRVWMGHCPVGNEEYDEVTKIIGILVSSRRIDDFDGT